MLVQCKTVSETNACIECEQLMIHATCCPEGLVVVLTGEWDSWDLHYWYTATANWKLFESNDRGEHQLVATSLPLNHFSLQASSNTKWCVPLYHILVLNDCESIVSIMLTFSGSELHCASNSICEQDKTLPSPLFVGDSRPFITTDETVSLNGNNMSNTEIPLS